MAMTDTEISEVSRVRSLYDQARHKKRPRVQVWEKSYKLVHNRGWSPLRDSWMPSPQASEVYPITAAMVGWMTDQRPALTVVPSADPHSAFHEFYAQLSRDLETTMQANWIVNNVDGEIEKVLWDAMIYGTGFFKVIWDASLAGGMGDAKVCRVDPYAIFPDPAATSMEDCNYIIEARNMSLQELERRFPGSNALLKGETYEETGVEKRPDLYASNGRTPMANPGGVDGQAPRWGKPGQSQRAEAAVLDEGVTVYECWIRENDHYVDDEGEVHVEDEWRVVVIAGNQKVLDEKAIDLFGHGQHPYERYVLHDLGEFWGISLVEHLAPLQISINRLLASMQAHAELVGNPVLLEDSRSGIPRTKIVNKPGQRVTKNAGAEVAWMTPPDMPNTIPELVRFYIGEMERVSGLSAIVRGSTPTGRNAQGVLDSVQEAAFVRVRLALRNLERTLRNVGQLLASLVVENYTAPRMVAIVGPSGERTSLALDARHFYIPTENGASPLKFQLWVQAGSSMPISRQARAAEADQMFALGAIDRQAVLEAHDYPNRDEILQRVMSAEAAGLFQPPGARQRRR